MLTSFPTKPFGEQKPLRCINSDKIFQLLHLSAKQEVQQKRTELKKKSYPCA